MVKALAWIRRDLRLQDSSVLELACREADQVAVVFVYDTTILDALSDRKDRRVQFIVSSLDEVHQGLTERGSGLITLHGNPLDLIPELAEKLGVDFVVAGEDFEPGAISRDQKVSEVLRSQGRELTLVKDQVVFQKREILNQSGEHFRVFTPYFRAWKAALTPPHLSERISDFSKLWPLASIPVQVGNRSMQEISFDAMDLWLLPGEGAGAQRLEAFRRQVGKYGEQRDFPSLEGTSGLSVHLRFGTVSPRQCVRAVFPASNPGEEKWLAELAWREFYQMILANSPSVVSTTFNPQYTAIEWPGSREHFEAWCQGQTGYPLVDAAMRCLNATGWMHNRLRMVTAMFLTKDLLCDYRWGEEYFAEKLLDFDLASNNGGWQWSASTGADAQPYFRVFNPLLQSRKFDPNAEFILKWVPELKGVDDPHWPHDGLFGTGDYPSPIVDHQEQKAKVLLLLARDPS